MNRRSVMTAMAGAGLVSVLPLGVSAFAQQTTIDSDKLPALMGGNYSTASSQLAMNNATSPVVRSFAELEIAEQAAVAMAFGTEPGSAGITSDKAAILQQLQAAEGSQFDMMYIEGQIAGHEELLAIHQAYARSGNDPMARGASMVGVTGIQSHLFVLSGIRRQI